MNDKTYKNTILKKKQTEVTHKKLEKNKNTQFNSIY